MVKNRITNQPQRSKQLLALLVVVIVAIVGSYLIINSHAATPYVSSQADSGTLTGGATKQACSGASDGNCVVFGGNNGGGTGAMAVGMNAGGWNTGNPGDDDVASAVKYVRLDEANCPTPVPMSYPVTPQQYTDCPTGGDIVELQHDGVKIDVDFSGPYNYGGGVSALIANGGDTTWADNALNWYKEYCGTTNTECPMIEVLNEPNGWWFWGTGPNDTTTDDQANADAYATLVHTTYQVFHNSLGSNSPLILASAYDNWGAEWWNYNSSVFGPSSSYVDGGVSHPYGGTTSDYAASAAGDQQQVITEHQLTDKPVYVTEVGWPTDDAGPSPTQQNETGDSDQWPEADSSSNANPGLDQCDNVYNFVSWARSTGYVNAVMIYGYISGNSNNAQYGLEFYNSSNGTTRKKDGWYALAAAARQQPNPCPSAANDYTLQSN